MSSLYSEWTSFHNRANRSELWVVTITMLAVGFVLSQLAKAFVMSNLLTQMMFTFGMELTVYPLLLLCFIIGGILYMPTIATRIRRLHDFNLSGWWLLPYYFVAVGILLFKAIIDGVILKSEAFQFIRDLDSHTTNIIVIAVFAVILFYHIVWYLIPGSRGSNKYGGDAREISKFIKKRVAEIKAKKKLKQKGDHVA